MTIFHKVTMAVANICLVYVPRLLPKSSEGVKSYMVENLKYKPNFNEKSVLKCIIYHFSCFVILISQNIYVLLFKMFVIKILRKKKCISNCFH